eukprot:scaffold400399_cov29-Prasinocladus_malaysianus.AAC.1
MLRQRRTACAPCHHPRFSRDAESCTGTKRKKTSTTVIAGLLLPVDDPGGDVSRGARLYPTIGNAAI